MRNVNGRTDRETIYSTGMVAKICQVAPQTVSKWVDAGHLKGYRLPGSGDRRILKRDLIEFMAKNGMPIATLFGDNGSGR